jgi:hypothetical protein
MKSISLIALASTAALSVGLGLLPSMAAAESCEGDKRSQVMDTLDDSFAFPIGIRLVVSDQWPDRPTRVGDKENRITDTVFSALMKLRDVSHAVTMVEAAHTPANGWESDEAVVKLGIFGVVDVEPTDIKREPSYTPKGDWFTVSQFAYSAVRIGSATALKSPTNHYCLVQFTFTATFSPMLRPLFDSPDTADRRARLLKKWDPFDQKWRFVAFDHEAQANGDFKKNNVGKAIQNLSLTR